MKNEPVATSDTSQEPVAKIEKTQHMKDEALRLALEALQYQDHLRGQAITAIKQALANDALDRMADNERELGIQMQPEPEPVAWMWRCKPYCGWPEWSVSLNRPADSGRDGNKRTEGYEDIPLYTSPPKREWQGLTENEGKAIVEWQLAGHRPIKEVINEIEAKLKEKNNG